MKSEKRIQHEILLALNKTFSDSLRLWRNNVGQGYGAWIVKKAIGQLASGDFSGALETLRQTRPISYGVPGSPDLQGFIRLRGFAVYFGVEVKDSKGKQSDKQEKFQRLITSFGGIYIVARDAQEAVDIVHSILEKWNTGGGGGVANFDDIIENN